MPFRTCEHPPSPCPRPEDPVINNSSEAPDDVDYFSGMIFVTDWDPPINPWVSATACGVTCLRPTLEEALACAAAIALSCQEDKNETPPDCCYPPNLPPMPPIPPTIPDVTARPRFSNQRLVYTITCPDGTPVTYIVEAGFTWGLSQAEADAKALALAQHRVVQSKWCITPISGLFCLDEPILGAQFSASGFNPQTPIQLYPIALISGAYPDGVQFIQFDPGIWTAVGSPTVDGLFTFTVRITNGDGTTKDSTMSMEVWSITTELDDMPSGTAVSQQLVATGTDITGDVWAVIDGNLPDGLVLSESGFLSGTPTSEATYNFTIQCNRSNTSGSGNCSKEYTVEVIDACITATTTWAPVNNPGGGVIVDNFGVASTIHQLVTGMGADALNVGTTLPYDGPAFILNLHVEWNGTGTGPADSALSISVAGLGVLDAWMAWGADLLTPGTYDIPVALGAGAGNPLTDYLVFSVQSISQGVLDSMEVTLTLECVECPWEALVYTFQSFNNAGTVTNNSGADGTFAVSCIDSGANGICGSQVDFADQPTFNANLHLEWSQTNGGGFFTVTIANNTFTFAESSGGAVFPVPGIYDIPLVIDAGTAGDILFATLDVTSLNAGDTIDVTMVLTCTE